MIAMIAAASNEAVRKHSASQVAAKLLFDVAIGFGAGVGSTVELFAPTVTPRPSIGVEAVLHVGECCRPGYVNVVARYDRFFAGLDRDVLTLSVGLAFF